MKITNINDFDELSDFISGEDIEFIVEYILCDDGGFCHRCSPFLMSVGTIFEHNFGTYKVYDITQKRKHIQVFCDRIDSTHKTFDKLHELLKRKN